MEAGRRLGKELFSCPPQTPIRIVSSDFQRALETAECIHKELTSSFTAVKLEVVAWLRERWFGELDMTSNEAYPLLWRQDAKDEGHTCWQVESTAHVANRVRQGLLGLQSENVVILVSHGDTLQILEAVVRGFSPGQHKLQIKHLETAEVRELPAFKIQ
jgi:probable phosphoglycerate mutase